MQPWARRGVPAASVTGGILAMGTGVASALGTSEGRAPQPRWAPDDDPLSFGGIDDLDLTQPIFGSQSGILDRDLPGRHRRTQRTPRGMELAGWVTDTARPGVGDQTDVDGVDSGSPDGDVEFGTPSEGFHRSMGWTGAIGAISADDAAPVGQALVIPTDDPATVTDFDEPDSIVELWDGLLGHDASAGLVTPDAADLTVGSLAKLPSEVYTVACELVNSVLSMEFAPLPPPHEFVPLTIPGEFQEQANEVPDVNLDWLTRWHRPVLDDQTMPLFASVAADPEATSRIAAALGGTKSVRPPPIPPVSTAPVTTLIRA